MRHIALEGRCFVISACQVQPSPDELGIQVESWHADRPLIAGGSMIVGPLGDVLAGPLQGETGLVTAKSTRAISSARATISIGRPLCAARLFKLSVDDTPHREG